MIKKLFNPENHDTWIFTVMLRNCPANRSISREISLFANHEAGCRQPYLFTDWNHFRETTTKPLGEHIRQVSIKNNISREFPVFPAVLGNTSISYFFANHEAGCGSHICRRTGTIFGKPDKFQENPASVK